MGEVTQIMPGAYQFAPVNVDQAEVKKEWDEFAERLAEYERLHELEISRQA
ncbi:hypothetical protein [Mesobacillus zeae]|uniref:hypothetical protein n=1 Tax=Mesobacillus zeae TaxID=1917180 RepID=UPI0015E7678F|nr:hypothetical protein [Mesobacillus zeae]